MLDVAEMRLAANAILDGGRRLQQQIENFLFLARFRTTPLTRRRWKTNQCLVALE